MAKARTAVQLSETWRGTVEVLNQDGDAIFAMSAPTEQVSISSVGCSGGWSNDGGMPSVEGCAHYVVTHQGTGPTDPNETDVYFPFILYAQAPGQFYPPNREEKTYFLKVGTYSGWPGFGGLGPVPEGATLVNAASTSAFVVMSVSGVYAKGERTTAPPPSDRQTPFDFTDQSAGYTWWADEESMVTVTAIGPDGTVLSASGPLAGAGEEIELGAAFWLSYSLSQNRLPEPGIVYARIGSPRWGEDGVDLSHVDLWYSASELGADRAPDQSNEGTRHWSRFEEDGIPAKIHVFDDGGIAIRAESSAYGAAVSWSGWTQAPWLVTFKPQDGMFSHEFGYAITYVSPAIVWKQEAGEWVWEYEEFSGDLQADEWRSSWEFPHEWQRLLTKSLYVYVDEEWREDNEEDVGSPTDPPSQNDRQCGLLLYPIDRSEFTGEPWWGPLVTVSHARSLDVNDPPGLEERPSKWTAVQGLTVDPNDDDKWTVPALSATPQVTREFATRYWLRLDRLADHLDDPEEEHNTEWPIMLKANLPIGATLDDPAWWNSQTGGVDGEDIWNWANFSYLRLGLEAPRSGTVTLTVDYSVPAISDPCYTCFEHRYGAEGEFSYTRTHKTVTYPLQVESGSNSLLIDLVLNDEEIVPSGEDRIQVVDAVTLELEGNDSEEDEEWELTALELVLDPGEGQRPEPEAHVMMRYKPAWDWLGPDWLGVGAEVDGLNSLEVDYGYGGSFGHTRYEKKLLYLQQRRHCPESELTDRLDFAKDLSRVFTEAAWQEGWSATWHAPADSGHNEDADENRLAGSLYWWDLRQCEEWASAGSVAMDGAVCVGTWQVLAGVRQEVHFTKYPRGRVRGLAFAETNRGRLRARSNGTVWIEGKRDADPTWSVVAAAVPDEHGAFR